LVAVSFNQNPRMITPATPPNPKSAATPAVPHPVDSFAEKLHQFWQRNSSAFLIGCVLVLVGIFARGGYEYYAQQHEKGIGQEFALASTPDQLKTFAAAHEGHALAGVAWVTLGDDAFKAGNYPEAIADYDKALPVLKDNPVAGRVKLGAAMARLLAGQATEGESALNKIADDANQLKGLRVEAAYQLASNAADAGKGEDVQKYVAKLMQIDGTSVWAQRAMMLRASTPVAVVAPAAASAPVPAATPAAAPAGEISIKVPGKN
jgi:predicted negative regulator of RcsB-dependent stress response